MTSLTCRRWKPAASNLRKTGFRSQASRCRNCSDFIQQMHRKKGLALEITGCEHMKAERYGDPIRVIQILNNLARQCDQVHRKRQRDRPVSMQQLLRGHRETRPEKDPSPRSLHHHRQWNRYDRRTNQSRIRAIQPGRYNNNTTIWWYRTRSDNCERR